MLGLLALVAFGTVQFFRKVAGATQTYGPSYMVMSALCLALFGTALHFVEGHSFDLSLEMLGLASVGGAIAGIGIFSMLLAFRMGGEGSILLPIAGLSVIVAVVLSIMVYREPLTGARLVGIGLGVSSVVMLSR